MKYPRHKYSLNLIKQSLGLSVFLFINIVLLFPGIALNGQSTGPGPINLISSDSLKEAAWLNIDFDTLGDGKISNYGNIEKDRLVNWYGISVSLSDSLAKDRCQSGSLKIVLDFGYTDKNEIYVDTIDNKPEFIIGHFTKINKNIMPQISPDQVIMTLHVNDTVDLLIVDHKISPWDTFNPKITTYNNWKDNRQHFIAHRNLTQGIFYGALLIIFLLNLLTYTIYRDKAYLFYAFYILSLCLSLLPPFELGYSIFLGQYPVLLKHLEMLGDFGFIIFYFLFITAFLNIRVKQPDLHKALRIFVVGAILILSACQLYYLITGLYTLTQRIYEYVSLISVVLLIITLISIYRQKDILSRLIITGTLFGLVGSGFVLVYRIISDNFPLTHHYVMETGHLLEIVMFSIGLSVRNKHIEQERKKIKELDSLKTKFFANISHEFRTPLTLIVGPLENFLQQGTPLSEKITQVMLKNARKLLNLVNQLLELSKIEAGVFSLQPEKTEVMGHMKGYVYTFETVAFDKHIELEIICRPDKLDFVVDKEKLNTILNNLIYNALKFTPEMGKVSVETGLQNNGLEIRVTDTGIGISPEKLPHIFDRFYQAHDQCH